MKYTQWTDAQISRALEAVGVRSIDDLFAPIPARLRLQDALNVPPGLDELALLRDVEALGARNRCCRELVCFLGGGAYDHFVPTVVDAVAGRSEFVTGYTPYQAEASQGILQLFFEFQTMICQLTGMEVANASLYEGATAAAEAMQMATEITGRRRVVLAGSVHPDTRHVLRTYAGTQDVQLVEVPAEQGVIADADLRTVLNDDTAGVVLQSPNFFGCLERLDRLIPAVRQCGAVAIVSTDPISCGLLKSPGALDADIVVAEGQPLGIPLQYGGPYLGLLSCREKHLRKMPGRVVGLARDRDGGRAFCLVLQTREQHIRRERATSNICTNQGLLAVRASVYLSAMGRTGVAEVARQCFDKAHYAAAQIDKLDGYRLRFSAPFFKEFVVQTNRGVREVLDACRVRGILAGVPLGRFDERWSDCFLVAVTEKRTRDEIDALIAALRSA